LRRLKATALLVTHDQHEAFAMADRIAVMQAGRIEQIATPGDLYRWPQTEFVATFLGAGTIIDARRVSEAGEIVLCEAQGGRFACRSGAPSDGVLRVLIRPEQVHLSRPGEVSNPVWSGCHVIQATESGEMTRITVDIDGVALEAVHLGLRRFAPGDRVDCTLDRDGPVVIAEPRRA
jgi:ABC-type Fe3+/spermidine/putrescine transport system ATPase subunit